MNWNRHEQLLKASEPELLHYLRSAGYILVREQYIFGRVLTFEHEDSGVRKWYIDGGLRDWPEVAAWLRETWRPQGREGQDWFVANLKEPETPPIACEPLHRYTIGAEVKVRYRWQVRATDDTDASQQAEQSFAFPWDDDRIADRIVLGAHVIEVVRAD